jgi:hypothetical protein
LNFSVWTYLFSVFRLKTDRFLFTCCTMNNVERNWSSCSTT